MKLGGNTIANTSGVLIADGKEIIALERGEGDLQLLLSIEIFDQEGRHIAKLRRNAWAFPDGGERYAITTNPGALTLTDTETGRVVVGAKVLGRNEVEVDRGDFFTPSGMEIVVTPESLEIATNLFIGNRIQASGAAIVLEGSTGISVGVSGDALSRTVPKRS
jgi:hypothetical protein